MAVTSIWAIHGDSIGTVMKYIANREKTDTGQFPKVASFHKIENVLEYDADSFKTEQQLLVTGIHCDPEPKIAADQFWRTKINHGGKTGGIICFHAYQSFKRGEVDGMTAHLIGQELAKRMWGDRFEVMVSTHMNTGTVHNHFCLNSVSFVDGMKYYSGKELNQKLRDVSDELCREYGLTVVIPRGKHCNREIGNRHMEEEGKFTWKGQIKKDMDEVLARNRTWIYFCRELEQRGYTLEYRAGDLRIRPDGVNKFWRLRNLGEGYSESELKDRLGENWKMPRPLFSPFHKPTREKPKGLYALYIHFCYLLGELPKTVPEKTEDYAQLKEAAKRMAQYSAESDMLGRNHIDTVEDLHNYTEKISAEYLSLIKQRQGLRNRLRRMNNTDEMNKVRSQIYGISDRIGKIRKEMELCKDIAERSGAVEAVVDSIEEVAEKMRSKTKTKEEEKEER